MIFKLLRSSQVRIEKCNLPIAQAFSFSPLVFQEAKTRLADSAFAELFKVHSLTSAVPCELKSTPWLRETSDEIKILNTE